MATMLRKNADSRHARPGADKPDSSQDVRSRVGLGRHRRDRPWRRRFRRLMAGLAVLLVALVLAPAVYVVVVTSSYRHGRTEVAPRSDAIVLGAGLRPGNRPSAFLERRLDAAVDLYRHGKVEGIFVSGDSSEYHDEVGVMRSYLLERDVPADAITVDMSGRDTYDSCWRARNVYGIDDAIVVTQEYHLPRAVYTCRRLGIDALGVGASGVAANPVMKLGYMAREIPADYQALWEVHVSRPTPDDVSPSAQD